MVYDDGNAVAGAYNSGQLASKEAIIMHMLGYCKLANDGTSVYDHQ